MLLAISETKATEILFVDCPELARSFKCEALEGEPNLRDRLDLSILGSPEWLISQGTTWTEWLKPWLSYTGYIRRRLDAPLSSDAVMLMRAGLTKTMAEKLLVRNTFKELKEEADITLEGLSSGLKLGEITTMFRMRKQAEAVQNAQPHDDARDYTITKITEIL